MHLQRLWGVGAVLLLALLSCDQGQRDGFAIGGTVIGTPGRLTLALAGDPAQERVVYGPGPFAFEDLVADGTEYEISIAGQEDGTPCQLSNGQGVVEGTHVVSIVVRCGKPTTGNLPSFTVGGSVVGLEGALVLRSGPDTLTLNEDGAFVFPTPRSVNTSYSVDVVSDPLAQQCTVTNRSGTIAADVTDVLVTCEDDAVAPTITFVEPADGSSCVQTNSDIHIQLDEIVDPASVNDVTVTISPALDLDFEVDGNEIRIVPTAGFESLTAYSVTVDGISDPAGNQATPLVVSFATEFEGLGGIAAGTSSGIEIAQDYCSFSLWHPMNAVADLYVNAAADQIFAVSRDNEICMSDDLGDNFTCYSDASNGAQTFSVFTSIDVDGNTAYVGTDNGLLVLDTSNVAAVPEPGWLDVAFDSWSTEVRDLIVTADTVYVAVADGVLVSARDVVAFEGYASGMTNPNAGALALYDGELYVASGGDLYVAPVSSLLGMDAGNTFAAYPGIAQAITSLDVDGTSIFVGTNAGVRVLAKSDLTGDAPGLAGTGWDPIEARGVTQGVLGHLLVATDNGLAISFDDGARFFAMPSEAIGLTGVAQRLFQVDLE